MLENTLLLDMPVDQAPTAVLDFETTGLSPASGDRVVELAVYRHRPDGQGKRRTHKSLVDPGMPMPALAESIHHISDAELVGAPDFAAALPALRLMLADAVLVAHNARFDTGFLSAECHRLSLEPPALGPVVCTLDLARQYFGFSKCTLESLAIRTGVAQPKAHRALDDARVTFAVYQRLLQGVQLGFGRMPTVRELIETIDQLGKDGAARKQIEREIRVAAQTAAPIVVDYTARHGEGPLTRRRTLTVRSLDLPHVEAYCHLRGEVRVFNLRRIQRVLPEGPADAAR